MQFDDPLNPSNGATAFDPSSIQNPGYGPAAGSPPWLQPGWVLNADGSVSLPNGGTIPAPPPGGTRDPNTGAIVYGNGGGASTQTGPPTTYKDFYSGNPYGYQGPATEDPSNGGGTPPVGGSTQTGSTVGDLSQFPAFTPPGFENATPLSAPNPYSYTPFSYQNFSAPTLEDAQNAPGYQFGLKQGQDALQNSAAARGTLRGGGTLKDLFGYTNAAAEQNYGNVFNQNLTSYNTNRDNAFGTWAANTGAGLNAYNTNWGTTKDVNASVNSGNQQNYQNAYQNAAGAFNPLFQGSTLSFQDSYNRWLAKLNSLTNIATAGGQ